MRSTRSPWRRAAWFAAGWSLVGLAGTAAVHAACTPGDTCLTGPLVDPPPGNPDNRMMLCSPRCGSVTLRVVPQGLEVAWDAPPPETATYRSDVQAARWIGLDTLAVVPSLEVSGTYLAFRDRRIQFDVQTIEATSGFVPEGTWGTERVRLSWTSIYEATSSGSVGGEFLIDATNVDRPLVFEARTPSGGTDPSVLAGLRVQFRSGFPLRREDVAFFDIEDFEGWHLYRWEADPGSPNYRAVASFSKLAAMLPPQRLGRIVFVDTNVFDGFLYHYAVRTYDQGFRRSTSGGTYGVTFESPLRLGTPAVPGPTQVRYEYRKPPPAEFQPITAVPNPFRDASSDGTRESEVVFFTGAPPRGTLYIFTLSGDLVLQREHTLPDIGVITWDTRNGRGERVASGVYIYKIVDLVSGRQSYGRLAIIR